MDHVVYLDAGADEMKNLTTGAKTMIVRGAAGRKMPYGRVTIGDSLYFINNNAEGLVKATAVVNGVLIEIENVTELPPFQIDKSDFGNMDDWLPVGSIENVRL